PTNARSSTAERSWPHGSPTMSPPATDLFLASCGLTGPFRLLVTGPGGVPREHLVDRPFLLAGRGSSNCVCLNHPAISRRHAYFQVIEGNLFGVDLESRTGGVWEGEGPGGWGWVSASRGVRLGPFTLTPTAGVGGDEPLAEGQTWPPPVDPLLHRVERADLARPTIEIASDQ